MSQEDEPRPPGLYLLMAALAFLGLSALAGGYGLTADPTGEAVGIPAEWLEGSPFSDYLIPGLFLLLVLGILPLVVAYGIWRCRPWWRPVALLVGLTLIAWIVIQISVIGYVARPPLQLVYGALGAVIAGLALLPPVRRYIGAQQRAD